MKNIKFLALIALALTLGLTACKKDQKDQDNSSKLFNTSWKGHGSITNEESNRQIEYSLYFNDDKTYELHEDHSVYQSRVDIVDPDSYEEYDKSGTFTLIGSKLTLYVNYVSEDFPKAMINGFNPSSTGIIEGSYSDGKMSIKLYGQELAFTKTVKPEK